MNLPVYSFTIYFKLSENTILEQFKGGMLRGIFGHALKKLICKKNVQSQCENCMAKQSCLYTSLFLGELYDRSGVPEKIINDKRLPTGWSIIPPLTTKTVFQKGETVAVNFNVAGSCIEYFEAFLRAFCAMQDFGIGNSAKSVLEFCYFTDNHSGKEYLPGSDIDYLDFAGLEYQPGSLGRVLTFDFITPCRLKQKKGVFITNHLTSEILGEKIIDRGLKLIFMFSNQVVDFTEKIELPSILQQDIKPYLVDHRSSVGGKMHLDGFTGSISIKINDEKLLPLIWLTQKMGIGIFANGGYGRFLIH